MNKEVEYLTIKDIESYIEFIKEVFGYEANKEVIEKFICKNRILIIKDENKVVASVTLEERIEHIKNQKYYYVSYLGVLKDYRREGYATKLFNKTEELVKEEGISYLELTSGNQRKAAHYFYKSHEFKVKDTTVFIKIY